MKIIVAICPNGAIGRHGELLYHIRRDLQRFKALTMGHTILMGRKTYESLPKGALPGRRNVVLSRNPHYTLPDAETFTSLNEALRAIPTDDIYIIGGAEIYTQALPMADELLLTVIHSPAPADADAFFPTIPLREFVITHVEHHPECSFYDLKKVR